MLPVLVAAATWSLVPVHGTVLDTFGSTAAIVRTDRVPGIMPGLIRRYRLSPAVRLADGDGVDALLDRSTTPPTLREAVASTGFAPGMPDQTRVVPVQLGGRIPAARLVDQQGRLIELDRSFRGKTMLLSFIFTRCPDATLCPAISGKFAYMQQHLNPAHFALVEITLDPPYDSPAIMRRYGASYGAKPAIWSLLTGTGSTVQRVLDEFGIDSMKVSSANYIHNDKLFIVSPGGMIADKIDTAGWDPQDAIAQARAVDGLASNPLARLKLAIVSRVVALCGGSQASGIVLMETVLYFGIVAAVAAAMWGVARILWPKQPQL
jgi:protein SCO1/2